MKNVLLTTLILFSFQLTAQKDLKVTALSQFNNQEWEIAAKNYKKYLKKNKTDSSAWYNLAVSQLRIEKYEESIKSFKVAEQTNFNQVFVHYNIGKAYVGLNDFESMYAYLYKAAENGLTAYAQMKSDTVFTSFQQEQTFVSILEKVKTNAYPCLTDENARHFDFWLGEWEVFVNGRKVGDNSITMANGGCAIHENYTTAGNYTGQSINFYDPVDEKWHQHWVGSSNDTYNYVETKRAPGLLQFISKAGTAGNVSLSKLTFTLNEDGTVRQLFENSTDDGETWSPAFDGLYKKKSND